MHSKEKKKKCVKHKYADMKAVKKKKIIINSLTFLQ